MRGATTKAMPLAAHSPLPLRVLRNGGNPGQEA
jgi:hypothetical protein